MNENWDNLTLNILFIHEFIWRRNLIALLLVLRQKTLALLSMKCFKGFNDFFRLLFVIRNRQTFTENVPIHQLLKTEYGKVMGGFDSKGWNSKLHN